MTKTYVKFRELQLRENPMLHPDKLAPHWLEIREGKKRKSFRINERRDGVELREKIKGDIRSWKDAVRIGEQKLLTVKYGEKPGPEKSRVRCEEIIEKILKNMAALVMAHSRSPRTLEQAEYYYDRHIKPWLNANYAFADELTGNVWLDYKSSRLLVAPRTPIRHDRYYFAKICRYAFRERILEREIELEYDPKREDHREEGKIIPDEHFQAMLVAAPRVSSKWRDRMIIQRYTGMRPHSEAGALEKSWIQFVREDFAYVHLPAESVKTRKARSVPIKSPMVLEVLRRRSERAKSRWLFPAQSYRGLPPSGSVSGDLSGWNSILERAKLGDSGYTPHDLRHTYLTEMFKSGNNYAQICHFAGLSLEEALKTYVHFKPEDGELVADMALACFGGAK